MTQKSLLEGNERLIFEALPTGVFIVDEQKRVVDINTLALDILKYVKREILGRVCHEFICPKKEGACPIFDKGEEVYNLETVIIRKDGKRIPVLKSCQKVELEGRTYIIEGFVDISERKSIEEENLKLQEQLFHSQKMEAVGTLASGVAHEFKNILTPISGYAEFLEEMVEDPEGKMYLDIIKGAAERGAEIANKMLGFSRKTPVDLRKFNFRSLMGNFVGLLKTTIPKNIRLDFHYRTRVRTIFGDPRLIEQALMNIVINACEAMADGGVLSIVVEDVDRPASCKFRQLERFVKVGISDTGHGMDEATKVKIFDPFFTTKQSGSGLGLYTTYNIIDRHGGCITVYSEKGVGTTFNIYLPVLKKKEKKRREVKEPVESDGIGRPLVFVVEDEKEIRDMIRITLRRRGFDVVDASNLTEAMKLYERIKDEIGLVILDVVLPDGMGTALLNQIRKEKGETLRVIVVSGYPKEFSEIRKIMKYGRIEYLPKPFKPQTLLNMVLLGPM